MTRRYRKRKPSAQLRTYRSEGGGVAHGPVKAVLEVKRDAAVRTASSWLNLHLLEHEQEQDARDGRKEDVVHSERTSELESRSRPGVSAMLQGERATHFIISLPPKMISR